MLLARLVATVVRPISSAVATTRRMSHAIALSPSEATFVALLDDFANRLSPPVECRIAGGWVRDKLLSLPSSDLDIALSIPSGHSFAVAFVDFLKAKNVPTGSVGKVVANPEQSKHLETGTTRIMGLECDFVGLRSETYADSRIPQVKPGTPFEDASRRDLTINALFYNVHTRQVEDYTKMGLSDLENRIARTPLPPRQTFQDDPLRIVRCVRFASRFNLTIAQEVTESIKQEDVKAGILSKVSKERIGIETTKMLHNNPFHALSLIHSLDLYPYMFSCEIDPPRQEAFAAAQILNQVAKRKSVDEVLWLATAAVPFRGLTVKRKGRDVPASSVVISEGLKTSVTNLFDAVNIISLDATRRSEIGMSLQHPAVRPWERSLTFAAILAILPVWKGEWDDGAECIYQQYEAFAERVRDLGLPEAIDKPLLLNGNDIQQLLSIPPSSLITTIRQSLNAFQLDNPLATKEECEKWLTSMWEGEGRELWEKNSQPPRPSKKAGKGEKRKR
ncbi:tRNA adenylyltransferase [Cryptococcus gattii E566]|uniref:tRNA adenylyltransferase, putative n=2 Tax=Cryptococcus gattii TaxID=37769 RepID=E6R0Q7_CRYGW|nr:tRNA adenylyltransferase, putative [Cryptococcus gattii WM276]ADV20434.1 tRNA adenylyltransferase, putative [Cryptococcus gattii WM276]KIR76997.1 tRNA adenylyltransferase [Cryptococcus gattii EJB2]KIY31499.1 tRNA adenylyltransferase [Cryptococcus gattii E566]KJD99697.1 tRNA adenylyltransferase [Cryptococcus gattii NT-10]